MAKVDPLEVYQPGTGGAPMAEKMDRVCNMSMGGSILTVNGEGMVYNPAQMTAWEIFNLVCCGKGTKNMIYQNPDNSKKLKYSFKKASCCAEASYSVATKMPGESAFTTVAKTLLTRERAPPWFACMCCDPCHGLPVPAPCLPMLLVIPCPLSVWPWGRFTDDCYTMFLSENTVEYEIKSTGERNKGQTMYTFHHDEKGIIKVCCSGIVRESKFANCKQGVLEMKPFRHVERTIFIGKRKEDRKPVATVKRVGLLVPSGCCCASTYATTHLHVDWTDKEAMAAASFDDYAALSLMTVSSQTGWNLVDSCIGDSPVGRVTNTMNLGSKSAKPDKHHASVSFTEFMPSIADGLLDTGDLVEKIKAVTK